MRFRFLSTAALLFGLTACTANAPPSASPLPAAQAAAGFQVRDELYFGMRKPDDTLVTEAEWRAFIDSVVTPRFPLGLTVLAGDGQYQPEGRPLVREPSKVLILIHPGGTDAERHIREIAAIYCRRFDQESVMRITSPVSQDFLGADADSVPAAGGPTARGDSPARARIPPSLPPAATPTWRVGKVRAM